MIQMKQDEFQEGLRRIPELIAQLDFACIAITLVCIAIGAYLGSFFHLDEFHVGNILGGLAGLMVSGSIYFGFIRPPK